MYEMGPFGMFVTGVLDPGDPTQLYRLLPLLLIAYKNLISILYC